MGRQIELDVGHLEEVAQIPVVGIVGIVSDIQRRRPLLADPCRSRFPLDSSGRGHGLVRLGDVVEELAFGLAFFECLLVEDIGKVHVWFIIRSEAVPEVLTADAKAETHHKG